jgi:hypothetical protein
MIPSLNWIVARRAVTSVTLPTPHSIAPVWLTTIPLLIIIFSPYSDTVSINILPNDTDFCKKAEQEVDGNDRKTEVIGMTVRNDFSKLQIIIPFKEAGR